MDKTEQRNFQPLIGAAVLAWKKLLKMCRHTNLDIKNLVVLSWLWTKKGDRFDLAEIVSAVEMDDETIQPIIDTLLISGHLETVGKGVYRTTLNGWTSISNLSRQKSLPKSGGKCKKRRAQRVVGLELGIPLKSRPSTATAKRQYAAKLTKVLPKDFEL